MEGYEEECSCITVKVFVNKRKKRKGKRTEKCYLTVPKFRKFLKELQTQVCTKHHKKTFHFITNRRTTLLTCVYKVKSTKHNLPTTSHEYDTFGRPVFRRIIPRCRYVFVSDFFKSQIPEGPFRARSAEVSACRHVQLSGAITKLEIRRK